MNYNKGCYRQPGANMYRPAPRVRDFTPPTVLSDTNCGCGDNFAEMNNRLAMVYSPYQEWQNIYNGEKALENGTLFAELDKPFYGKRKGGCGCD